MKKRMDGLWRELELAGTPFQADVRGVLSRVNDSLNAAPEERRQYMKFQIKRAVMLAAATLLLAGSALAAATNWDVLGVFFKGDTSPAQAYVQSPNTTVGDGQFRVVLESCVTDRQNAFLILTVRALTEEAKEALADQYFADMGAFNFWAEPADAAEDGSDALSSGFWSGELPERTTEESRTFHLQIEYLRQDAAQAWLEFGFLPEGTRLHIPLDHAVGVIERKGNRSATDRDGKPYLFTGVTISPLTVQFRYRNPEGQGLLRPVYLFQMADGSMRTVNQLAIPNWAGSGYEDDLCLESATFRTVQDLAQIRAVVVDGTAFPLDGSAPRAVAVDEGLYPFQLPALQGAPRNGPFLLPVETLCRQLGASYTWDADAGCATLSYRGATLTLTVGRDTLLVNGEAVALRYAPALREGQPYLDIEPFLTPWQLGVRVVADNQQNIPTGIEITP